MDDPKECAARKHVKAGVGYRLDTSPPHCGYCRAILDGDRIDPNAEIVISREVRGVFVKGVIV